MARFGQADHVRYYGDDFETRLMDAGLSLTRVTPEELLGERMCAWMKLRPDEPVWIARASGTTPTRDLGLDTARLPAIWEAMLEQLVAQRAREERLRTRLRRIRAERDRLRRRPPEPHPRPQRVPRLLRRLRRRPGE